MISDHPAGPAEGGGEAFQMVRLPAAARLEGGAREINPQIDDPDPSGPQSRWSIVIIDIPYPHILSSATFPAALLRVVFERALGQGISGGGQRVLPPS